MSDLKTEAPVQTVRLDREALIEGADMLQRLRTATTKIGEIGHAHRMGAAADEKAGVARGENRLIADSTQAYMDGVNRWRDEVMRQAKAHFAANGSLYPDSFSRIPPSESPSGEIYIGRGDRPEHLVDFLTKLGIMTRGYGARYFQIPGGIELLANIQGVRKGTSADHTQLFQGPDMGVWFRARRNHHGEIEHYLTVDVTADINAHGDKIPKRRNAMAYAQGLGVGVNRTADELITAEGLLSGQQRPLVLDSRE